MKLSQKRGFFDVATKSRSGSEEQTRVKLLERTTLRASIFSEKQAANVNNACYSCPRPRCVFPLNFESGPRESERDREREKERRERSMLKGDLSKWQFSQQPRVCDAFTHRPRHTFNERHVCACQIKKKKTAKRRVEIYRDEDRWIGQVFYCIL